VDTKKIDSYYEEFYTIVMVVKVYGKYEREIVEKILNKFEQKDASGCLSGIAKSLWCLIDGDKEAAEKVIEDAFDNFNEDVLGKAYQKIGVHTTYVTTTFFNAYLNALRKALGKKPKRKDIEREMLKAFNACGSFHYNRAVVAVSDMLLEAIEVKPQEAAST
jgi:hypothetical protein